MKTTNWVKKLFFIASIFILASTNLFAQEEAKENNDDLKAFLELLSSSEFSIPEVSDLQIRTLRGTIKVNKNKEISFVDVIKKTYKVEVLIPEAEEQVLKIKNKRKQYVSGLVDDENLIFYIYKVGFLQTPEDSAQAK